MAPVSKKMKERMLAKKEKNKGGGSGLFHFLKSGMNRIRPVPVKAETDPIPEVITFYFGNDIGNIISPMTFGEPCPIMEKYEKLKKLNNEDDAETIKAIAPKKKYCTFALKYEDEKGKKLFDGGPRLVLLPMGVGNQLIDFYTDEEENYGDFTHPVTGYDLKIKKTGEKLNKMIDRINDEIKACEG